MDFPFWKKEDEFWPIRKVLINHLLLNFPQQRHYQVNDFVLPVDYPRHLGQKAKDSTHVLKELIGYSSIGIEIGDLIPGNDFKQLLGALIGSGYSSLKKDIVLFTPKQLKELPEATLSIIGPHVRFPIQTDLKKQFKAEKSYLEKYRLGKLSSANEIPVFGYEFTEKLFDFFITQMVLRHGRSFQLDLIGLLENTNQYEDSFLQVFSEFAPKDFVIWRKGKVNLRFYEHLLTWVVLKEQLILKGFEISHKPNVPSRLYLEVPARKPKSSTFFNKTNDNHKISLIEVLANGNPNTFYVYLNQDYLRPITFRKHTKTGQIIYQLATEGSINISGLEKIYEYFHQYERFTIFKKGKYQPAPLLDKLEERDREGNIESIYIIPHAEVTFKMITEDDIR